MRRVFRPSPWLRLWHTVLGIGLCMTAAMAPIGLWFFALVLLKRVVVSDKGIFRSPLGGSVRFDKVARWGRFHQARRRDTDGVEHVARDFIVLQERSGRQMTICLNDFNDSSELNGILHERLGPSTSGVVQSWFRGPRFPGSPDSPG